MSTLTIDGSFGEGGGQILRTSLALSLLTNQPCRIQNIRAGRSRPGLMRQHLTAVRAAAAISDARLEGGALNSQEILFQPDAIRGGEYRFSVGTAGSTMLVLQTILLPLALTDTPSRVTLEGGTHAMSAPPFEYVSRVYLPLLRSLGLKAHVTLERHGFYPAGGGRVVVEIEPSKLEGQLSWTTRPEVVGRTLKILNARLPDHVASREAETFLSITDWPSSTVQIEAVEDSVSPGNIMIAELEFETHREIFSEIGKRGTPAEVVATRCASQVTDFLATGAAAGEHLCDQLLLPLSLGNGGHFTAQKFTEHSRTQAWLIPKFIDVTIESQSLTEDDDSVEVHVEPRKS